MDIPELILITWNRHNYLKKMLDHLLSDPADFRLYCWDNGSTDATRDLVAELQDDRIVEKHLHPENVNQTEPCLWFFDRAKSHYIGKVDDDILLPHGWTHQLVAALRRDGQFGMLGCWIFMEEDWNTEKASLNTRMVSGINILRMTGIAGHSFLARREVIRRYTRLPSSHGLPVDRTTMTLDGYISGIPLPPLMAHNMDDPRSPHCMQFDQSGNLSALTARKRGFTSIKDYTAWIAHDAQTRLTVPIDKQIEQLRLAKDKSYYGRIRRKILNTLHLLN